MRIEYDESKRAQALANRGLDFAEAAAIFAGRFFSRDDYRIDYGERRFITVGYLRGRMVVLVWTPRGDARRVIILRKANEREQAIYRDLLG